MQLLAIVGKKRSGKDTTAEFVQNNYTSESCAFADPIKEALNHAYKSLDIKRWCNVELDYEDWDGFGFEREAPLIISNSDAAAVLKEACGYLTRNYNLPTNTKSRASVNTEIELLVGANTEIWSIRRFMQALGTDIVVNLIDKHFWSRCLLDEFLDTMNDINKFFIVRDVRHTHELELMRNLGAIIIFLERDEAEANSDKHISEAGLVRLSHEPLIKNNGTLQDLENAIIEVLK